MSKLINELSNFFNSCPDRDNSGYIDDARQLVNNISPNVLKHIKIAELQDELVKLGFKKQYFGCFCYYPQLKTCIDYQRVIEVNFTTLHIATVSSNDKGEWVYDSESTWQQDALTKVRELINEN